MCNRYQWRHRSRTSIYTCIEMKVVYFCWLDLMCSGYGLITIECARKWILSFSLFFSMKNKTKNEVEVKHNRTYTVIHISIVMGCLDSDNLSLTNYKGTFINWYTSFNGEEYETHTHTHIGRTRFIEWQVYASNYMPQTN